MVGHFHMKNLSIMLTICVLTCVPLRAELKWDTQKAELSPQPGDAFVETKFGFVNAGQAAVVIDSVQSSCGCTIATLAKTTYAPGERGEILARFNIGDRRGVNSKSIRVAIKGEPEPAVLTLVVTIPEPARITPAMLVWDKGEAGKAKTISVQAQPNQPVRVLKVTSSTPNFTIAVETSREAQEYRITVTPQNTETPGFALLSIETLLMGQRKIFPAYAQIRPRPR